VARRLAVVLALAGAWAVFRDRGGAVSAKITVEPPPRPDWARLVGSDMVLGVVSSRERVAVESLRRWLRFDYRAGSGELRIECRGSPGSPDREMSVRLVNSAVDALGLVAPSPPGSRVRVELALD
jgi:hypothetical protein